MTLAVMLVDTVMFPSRLLPPLPAGLEAVGSTLSSASSSPSGGPVSESIVVGGRVVGGRVVVSSSSPSPSGRSVSPLGVVG